jgi:hypothetical protein
MAMTGRTGETNRTLTLDEVGTRFENWRQNRRGKDSIPDELWSAAVEVARKEGLNRTSSRLHVEWNQLKRRMTSAWPVSRAPAPPVFVELTAPGPECRQECMIEMEGRRGKLRIHLQNTTAADLASLSRTLWEAAS